MTCGFYLLVYARGPFYLRQTYAWMQPGYWTIDLSYKGTRATTSTLMYLYLNLCTRDRIATRDWPELDFSSRRRAQAVSRRDWGYLGSSTHYCTLMHSTHKNSHAVQLACWLHWVGSGLPQIGLDSLWELVRYFDPLHESFSRFDICG